MQVDVTITVILYMCVEWSMMEENELQSPFKHLTSIILVLPFYFFKKSQYSQCQEPSTPAINVSQYFIIAMNALRFAKLVFHHVL